MSLLHGSIYKNATLSKSLNILYTIRLDYRLGVIKSGINSVLNHW
jgi:hypothetical protein